MAASVVLLGDILLSVDYWGLYSSFGVGSGIVLHCCRLLWVFRLGMEIGVQVV